MWPSIPISLFGATMVLGAVIPNVTHFLEATGVQMASKPPPPMKIPVAGLIHDFADLWDKGGCYFCDDWWAPRCLQNNCLCSNFDCEFDRNNWIQDHPNWRATLWGEVEYSDNEDEGAPGDSCTCLTLCDLQKFLMA